MEKVILFLISALLYGFVVSPQTVMQKKHSNLAVNIKLLNSSFTVTDSVKFPMTITNLSNSTQKILFDKPLSKRYPWSTNVFIRRKSGPAVKVTTWAFLSSQLYMEEQLKNLYRELKPGRSVSHIYYLSNVVRFDTKDAALPKGTYVLQVNYNDNLSNKVVFAVLGF